MTTRDTKDSKLALCRGRFRLSFYESIFGQHLLTKHGNILIEVKKINVFLFLSRPYRAKNFSSVNIKETLIAAFFLDNFCRMHDVELRCAKSSEFFLVPKKNKPKIKKLCQSFL